MLRYPPSLGFSYIAKHFHLTPFSVWGVDLTGALLYVDRISTNQGISAFETYPC